MDSKDSVLGPLAGSRKEMNCRVQKKKSGSSFTSWATIRNNAVFRILKWYTGNYVRSKICDIC